MAIDQEKFRWASVDENDPTTGNPNKLDPSTEFKNSGVKANEPLPRQWLNNQFNEQYNALVDIQAQIDAIVGGSSQPTLQAVYPIGAVYLSYQNTDPNTVFGFGTWVAVEGKFLVGVDTGDVDFDTAGKTGGSKTHTHGDSLSVDDHILTIDEIPPHDHDYNEIDTNMVAHAGTAYNIGATSQKTSSTGGGLGHDHTLSGGVQSASSLTPYFAVYIWHRTA